MPGVGSDAAPSGCWGMALGSIRERRGHKSDGRSRGASRCDIELARQCHKVFGRACGRIREDRIARREARGAAGARPRRGDSGGRLEAHIQALLSRAEPGDTAGERHRAGVVHRPLNCSDARWARICGERRRGARDYRHAGTAEEPGMSRVLVVEDEAHLAGGLQFNLKAEGHSAELANDGESALKRLLENKEHFDAVVLDVMLPGIDGFAVATALRKAKNYVPVLMLTARGRPEDVLAGFAAGADEYLPKPFQLPIFLARLQGLLRRTEWLRGTKDQKKTKAAPNKKELVGAAGIDDDLFTFNGKTIDFGTLELHAGRNTIQLTLMEANLLRHLIRIGGRT